MDQGEGAGRQGEELSARAHRSRLIRVGSTAFHVADDKPTFWGRVEAGAWEPATLAALHRLIRPGSTLLDIGAWVGPITLYAAALGAGVVAIEPDPAAVAELRANVAANHALAGRVRIVDRALSARPGLVRLGARRKPGDSMSSTLLADAASSWDAEAITPGELAELVGDPGALVVKMDIEGGEYAVLPALAPWLATRQAAVLLSLHPAILRESGVIDTDGAAQSVLAPFADWHFHGLAGREPAFSRDHAGSDEWLLLPPGRVLPPG